MAIGAKFRRRPVENYALAVHLTRAGVTLVTQNVFVSPFQRKIRLRLVVEERRLPMIRIVATIAIRCAVLGCELTRVRVFMAS